MPQTPDGWLEVSRQYEENWAFRIAWVPWMGNIQLQVPFSSVEVIFSIINLLSAFFCPRLYTRRLQLFIR